MHHLRDMIDQDVVCVTTYAEQQDRIERIGRVVEHGPEREIAE